MESKRAKYMRKCGEWFTRSNIGISQKAEKYNFLRGRSTNKVFGSINMLSQFLNAGFLFFIKNDDICFSFSDLPLSAVANM
jgi:hypothetical protein